MGATLHPAPRTRDVVLEQIRIVARALRPVALVLAVVFGIVTILIAVSIVARDAEQWFDSGEWFQLCIFSFFLPFAVWLRDRRFGPAFLWTLPVDRRRLALAKVFAGWVWLATGLAIVIVWQRVLALLSGLQHPETIPLIAFLGVTAAYLFGSAVVVGLRHPLRFLFGTAGVMFLVSMLTQALPRRFDPDNLRGSDAFFSAIEHAVHAWGTFPYAARWTITTLLCLAALWAAVSRHREHRRH